MSTGSVEEFEAQRPRLFGLAYRLLGSAQEAEDAVQDAFLRWDGAHHAAIEVPGAWLAKVVTNLCLNRLTSARAQRERYIGPWLPEPVLTDHGAIDPLDTAEQRDSVSLALLTLLERLTPTERAVFVLREAFSYSHREIGEVLELSEANCRQQHRRARQRLEEDRPRFHPDRNDGRQLMERFLAAAQDGDMGALEQLLAAEVTAWSDGGGIVTAGRRPVFGRTKVARLFSGLLTRIDKYVGGAPVQLVIAEANGQPALLGWVGGQLLGVLVLDSVDGQIVGLRAVANPEKLGFLARQAEPLSHSDGLFGS